MDDESDGAGEAASEDGSTSTDDQPIANMKKTAPA
jgi:hypothetical protein